MTDLVIDVLLCILCFILGYFIHWQISLSDENRLKNCNHTNIKIKKYIFNAKEN